MCFHWLLKIRNWKQPLHVFSFLHKLSFENSFCFLSILSCQTSFLISKIENCFWKQKIRGKNSYQTYPNFLLSFFSKTKLLMLISRNPNRNQPNVPWNLCIMLKLTRCKLTNRLLEVTRTISWERHSIGWAKLNSNGI